MNKHKFALTVLAALTFALPSFAQRQLEKLGRGMTAMRTGTSTAYVGWRLLGTDPADTKFNLYRVTSGVTNLIAANVTNSCNYSDANASQASAHAWFVQPILNGVTQANSVSYSMPANAAIQQYISIPLTPPPDGVAYDGVPYTMTANDCSAADVDGDGEYEIILKWDPSNSKDNSFSGFTGNTFLDCYKLNGTRLWRIDLGPNIRSGAHYMDFMVFDYDGDGKAVAPRQARWMAAATTSVALQSGRTPTARIRRSTTRTIIVSIIPAASRMVTCCTARSSFPCLTARPASNSPRPLFIPSAIRTTTTTIPRPRA
jgi:rhamnogalacturonan endolyase